MTTISNGDVVYKSVLDTGDILAGLKKIAQGFKSTEDAGKDTFKGIGKEADGFFRDVNGRLRDAKGRFVDMGGSGKSAFGSIGGSAGASGLAIGAIAGITASVTSEFINLGKQAIDVLVNIGQQSVQTALEIDTLRARLLGIFDGSQEAASQAFTFIQDKSKELGIDLTELAGAFLPKTENLQQFERVAKLATALARSDPEQGAIGARIALIEALSGTFTSLQRRFEIPKQDIDRIREAFDTQGMEGFVTTLEKILAESGKSFDDLANTAQTSFSRLGIAGEQLGGRLGEPIVASLEQAALKILDFVNANEDELIVFADTIGRAIADVIDFLSSVDLEGIDIAQLQEMADYIFRIVNALQLASSQLNVFVQSFAGIPGVTQTIDTLGYGLANLDDALITLSQIFALVNASLAAFTASASKAQVVGNILAATGQVISLNFTGAYESIKAGAETLAADTSATDAFTASMQQSAKMLDDYKAGLTGNEEAQKRLADELERAGKAGTSAADGIMEANQANKEAEQSAQELADAQAKVNEKFTEAEKDFQQDLQDIDIAAERKRLDTQIEFAQKREDAAKNNLEKITDLYRKNEQDIADAATDLSRKEEDIARKFSQERIDLEKEQRQKRVEVEEDFRKRLQEIQSTFLEDADEAEQKRDAVAFLRAMKQRDKALAEATQERVTSIEQVRIEGEQRAAELAVQRQREIEEARIDNERKLEDIRLNLERQIEEQNIAYARQLEDIRVSEERKNEELRVARERDIEDAKTAYARKLEDLRAALAEELALIEAHAAAVAEAEARSRINERRQTTSTRSGGGSNIETNRNQRLSQMQMFASGGFAGAGTTALVGENGPELVTFPRAGMIMNSQRTASVINQQKMDNSKNFSMGLLDPGSIDALLSTKIKNVLANELMGI